MATKEDSVYGDDLARFQQTDVTNNDILISRIQRVSPGGACEIHVKFKIHDAP